MEYQSAINDNTFVAVDYTAKLQLRARINNSPISKIEQKAVAAGKAWRVTYSSERETFAVQYIPS